MKKLQILVVLGVLLPALHSAAAAGRVTAGASLLQAPPPPPYQAQSKLLAMPDFVPGYGKLFVDPKTLPTGPFLGYDRKGHLINITYMVAAKDFDNKKDFANLKWPLPGVKIDHVSMDPQNPHPGIEVPHYHITLWLISRSEQKRLK